MQNFALLLDRLFFTYSHLAKERLLIDYFRKTPDPERGYALAIMAGTLPFPTFKRNQIKEMMARFYDPYLLDLSYDYVGDMSETVALLWPDRKKTSPLPALSGLIKTFNELPVTQVASYLENCLNQANVIERWALLKLGLGSLRIGVSARFLKKVLANFGEVKVDAIERIWHGLQVPYLSLFAWLENKQNCPDIKNQLYFHPVMLSHQLEEEDFFKLQPSEFAIEKKYDGIRVQCVITLTEKALYTRTGDDISHTFPDVLETLVHPVVLDGELMISNQNGIGSFNDLQKRLNRKKPSAKMMATLPAIIMLYDLLSCEQEDLTQLSFETRRTHLEAWFSLNQPSNMLLSEILPFESHEQLIDLRHSVLLKEEVAIEGLMLKRKESHYIPGRPKGHWYKWKRDAFLIDAVMMYAQRGHGKRSSFYSDYTFGLWKGDILLPIGKAYSGFSDEELVKLDRWVRHHTVNRFGPVREVEKNLVLEVAYDAANRSKRHKSGVALRFPRINRIRWDKPAAEADQLQTLIQQVTSSQP